MPENPLVCLSIVSHGQGELVCQLLRSIKKHCTGYPLKVVVTLNIEEPFHGRDLQLSHPLKIRKNKTVQGFGKNHNEAFEKECDAKYFCVLNPDILLRSNPFPKLIEILEDSKNGVAGPTLLDSAGRLQDSARRFPSPKRIMLRRLGKKGNVDDFRTKDQYIYPDWIAGMFMLFPSRIFSALKGFDERFFMYCEDADICMRLMNDQLRIVCARNVTVIHDPRRQSHRSISHFYWHVCSLCRFFIKWRMW